MDNIEIDKILKSVRFEIDSIRYIYNIEPNKIIIGSELSFWIACYFLDWLRYVDNRENGEKRYELYGIPVMIDYDNPWNVEVCICFKVRVNDESICNR